MRRRKSESAPVSFFSFQDVLLCLIGIAIVVAMTLILQVTAVTVRTVEHAVAVASADVPADEREKNLRDRIAALEAALVAAERRPDLDPLVARTSLKLELEAKAGELGSLQERVRLLEDELRALLIDNPGAAALREYLQLLRLRDERAEKLSGLEQRKQITFIIDEAQQFRPVVMELTRARIVVTDIYSDVPMRVCAATEDAQCMSALALFDQLNAEQPSYILLIVTPSGIPMYQKMLAAIYARPEASRPRIGLDLLPEGSFVAAQFPSGQGGAR